MTQIEKAVELLGKLREHVGDSSLLEYVVGNYMTGDAALDAMETYARENDLDELIEGEGEEIEPVYSVGDSVMINEDNDNEGYAAYRGQQLIVSGVYTSTSEHQGFDSSSGDALYDLQTEDGDDLPFSLYEYELQDCLV